MGETGEAGNLHQITFTRPPSGVLVPAAVLTRSDPASVPLRPNVHRARSRSSGTSTCALLHICG